MRVAVLLIVLTVCFNSLYLTVSTGQDHSPSWNGIALILGSLAAKAVQRPFESKPTDNPQDKNATS